MGKEQGPTPDDYRDARGPEWRAIFDTLRDYRLSNMTYEGTSDEFYPLVDLMSNEGQGIDTGEMQMVELADEISLAVKTARRSSDEQAEVVAWRWRTAGPNNDGSPVGTWYYGPSEPPLGAIGRTWAGWECEPLAIASPPAVAAGGVTALLDAYEAQVKLTPLGHENIQRGRSTYNWKMAVIAELRELAALPTPPSRGEGV